LYPLGGECVFHEQQMLTAKQAQAHGMACAVPTGLASDVVIVLTVCCCWLCRS
jgi:hypothetical protein